MQFIHHIANSGVRSVDTKGVDEEGFTGWDLALSISF
jgi:hypothetical protein